MRRIYDPYMQLADIMRGKVVHIKKADVAGYREDEDTELLCILMKDGSYHMVEDRDDERTDGLTFPHEFRLHKPKEH